MRNVVFDIGNVVVRWDPELIVARTFGAESGAPACVQSIFGHQTWYRLNRGEITEEQAKQAYRDELGLASKELDALFFHVKDTQDLNSKTVDLMHRLSTADYRLFALSDNVREIVAYLRRKYDFWGLFQGTVISAEVGCLKPSREIFNHLLDGFGLNPKETVFLDDVRKNVDGAREAGIAALQFFDAETAEAELLELGLNF